MSNWRQAAIEAVQAMRDAIKWLAEDPDPQSEKWDRVVLRSHLDSTAFALEVALSGPTYGRCTMLYTIHRRGYVDGKPLDLASHYDHSNMERVDLHLTKVLDINRISVGDGIALTGDVASVCLVHSIWHGANGANIELTAPSQMTIEHVAALRAAGWKDTAPELPGEKVEGVPC